MTCTAFVKITRGGAQVWWQCTGCRKEFVSETLWTRHAETEAAAEAKRQAVLEARVLAAEERMAKAKFLNDLEKLREAARSEALAELTLHLEGLAALAEEALAANGGEGPANERIAGRADGLRLAFNAAKMFK